MRTAIFLWGNYSDIFMKTCNVDNPDYFLLFFTNDEKKQYMIEDSNKYLSIKSSVLSSFPEELNLSRMCKYTTNTNNAFTNIGISTIKEYEEKNNIKYNRIIISKYRNVIVFLPNINGIFSTYINEVCKEIPYINIVSDYFIEMNNRKIHIDNLSINDRRCIFSLLFGDRIQDAEFLSNDTSYSKHIFLIPSVIHTSLFKLSYTSSRSIFSHNERLNQTINQCKSIQNKKEENDKTILLEGSSLSISEMYELLKYTDKIVLFNKHPEGEIYANEHKNKNIYETFVMKFLLDKLCNFSWVFKFGGRYRLSECFSFSEFENTNKYSFKIVPKNLSWTNEEDFVECVLYSVPFSLKEQYCKKMEILLSHMKNNTTNNDVSVEKYNYVLLKNDINPVKNIHVIGNDAIEGNDRLF